MKIRTDFVTNSSSSSFIIAYNNENPIDENTLEKYPFLKEYNNSIGTIFKLLEKLDYYDHGIISNEEKLEELIFNEYDWQRNYSSIEELLKNEEYAKEKYDKYIEYIRKGYSIHSFSIPHYDNEGLKNIVLANANFNENFIIIENYE